MKGKNALSAIKTGMEAASGRQPLPPKQSNKMRNELGLVLIGSHWPPEVRRTLKLVEYETGRKLKPLMGEAINDLCAKYGVPEPCTIEELG